MPSCPYLGLKDDPGSHFRVPTYANFCHMSNPSAPVKPGYQETVCLSASFRLCPVMNMEAAGRLPRPARARPAWIENKAKYFGLILLLVLILLLILGINGFFINPQQWAVELGARQTSEGIPSKAMASSTIDAQVSSRALSSSPSLGPSRTFTPGTLFTFTPVAAVLPSATCTDASTISSTPSFTPLLATTLPAASLTPELLTAAPLDSAQTPGPNFQTPFGPGNGYLLHHVSEGESLSLIAKTYQTDPDTIVALNAWISELGLRPNRVILIVPGLSDARGVVPFEVVFTQMDIMIADFAESHGVSVQDVRFYNQLGSEEIIPMGRWLICPHDPKTVTPSVTNIPTPDLSKVIAGPFGPSREYVLHRVEVGDSIPTLEKRYLTSGEVIQAANLIYGSIQLGQVLVIIPNQKEVIDNTRFTILQVQEAISVEKLAAQLGVLYADILYYNNLKQAQDIEAGRWIIYPTLGTFP